MSRNSKIRIVAFAIVLFLAGCISPGAPVESPGPAVNTATPEQMLAAINAAAAGNDDKELAVQPLRDAEVEDLRETAKQAVAARNYPAAAEALNQALLIVPDDPAVLQERAEVALLQSEFDRAETLAQRAFDLGSKVGPLCRRHSETVRQVRERRLDIASAPARGKANAEDVARQASNAAHLAMKVAEASSQLQACTVPGLNRM